MIQKLSENGGRRLGIKRRQFSFTQHIPERRSGRDRRSGNDKTKTKNMPITKIILTGRVNNGSACFIHTFDLLQFQLLSVPSNVR
jgi:hypothetical protein